MKEAWENNEVRRKNVPRMEIYQKKIFSEFRKF
jgi:hypothetical protein